MAHPKGNILVFQHTSFPGRLVSNWGTSSYRLDSWPQCQPVLRRDTKHIPHEFNGHKPQYWPYVIMSAPADLSPWFLATVTELGLGQSVPHSEWWPACTQTTCSGQQTPHRATHMNMIHYSRWATYKGSWLILSCFFNVTLVMSMSSESNCEMTVFTEGWWEYCLMRVSWIWTCIRTSFEKKR